MDEKKSDDVEAIPINVIDKLSEESMEVQDQTESEVQEVMDNDAHTVTNDEVYKVIKDQAQEVREEDKAPEVMEGEAQEVIEDEAQEVIEDEAQEVIEDEAPEVIEDKANEEIEGKANEVKPDEAHEMIDDETEEPTNTLPSQNVSETTDLGTVKEMETNTSEEELQTSSSNSLIAPLTSKETRSPSNQEKVSDTTRDSINSPTPEVHTEVTRNTNNMPHEEESSETFLDPVNSSNQEKLSEATEESVNALHQETSSESIEETIDTPDLDHEASDLTEDVVTSPQQEESLKSNEDIINLPDQEETTELTEDDNQCSSQQPLSSVTEEVTNIPNLEPSEIQVDATDQEELMDTTDDNTESREVTEMVTNVSQEESKDETLNENQEIILPEEAPSMELIEMDQVKDKQLEDMSNIQNPLFVNLDSSTQDVQTTTDAAMEVDPIASPQLSDIIEPEIILADNNDEEEIMLNTNDVSEEKYVVTKCNIQEEKTCMICTKVACPNYAFTNKTELYICSEGCFDKFKNENDGKYVIQGIRVKTFDMVTATDFSNELSEKCKSCNNSIGSNAISLASITFCDVDCLKKFYRTTCGQCTVCHMDVKEEFLGKYWLRFGLNFKAFCSYDCYSKYDITNICKYCRAELPMDNKTEHCDDLCTAGYMKVERIKECSVCHQEKNAAIEFINDVQSHYFCGEPCFVAYKFVNKTDMKECEICHRYVVEKTMLANSIFNQLRTLCICSVKCRSIYILMNSNKIRCKVCDTKKDNFDCVKKKNDYYCSLYCYEKLYIIKRKCSNCDVLAPIAIKEDDLIFCCFYCYNSFKIYENVIDNDRNKSYQVLNAYYFHYNDDGTITRIPLEELVYVKPPTLVKQRNVATMVRPNQVNKGINCKPKDSSKSIQTDEEQEMKLTIPIPVPIYVPAPVHMSVDYVPIPFPIPIPVPVPIFIPTTRNSVKGILKEISKIKNKVPADPLEAELLMMAEMVAEDKKDEYNSSDEEETETFNEPPPSNFGEDVIQMALKMADDFEEPVDLEGEVSVSTIRPPTSSCQPVATQSFEPQVRKRGRPKSVKKNRPESVPSTNVVVNQSPASTQKPDANLCLKYTFGVNAWKQWVTTKNNELEKSSKRPKLFKAELLQLTTDELNYSLCLFVKEVRKPNGSEYAPDTIYYLCLGIQQYLYENNRIDNIFCDAFYEKFTDCLNDVSKKFSLLYNESQYIVTRVEEEHLWESKQLGAHSPLVLLNTLMFFNTKHFSLTTVNEHLQLSFSHIMKHWKRNPNQPGARNVLLRFYPPQCFQIENKKKKMYEQQENEENPIRCPVKLYEFFLSKCPESVKTRNDVFYLLPERSCVPDSPLWYSTMALDQKSLDKMLNRVKMVKEINIALLSN